VNDRRILVLACVAPVLVAGGVWLLPRRTIEPPHLPVAAADEIDASVIPWCAPGLEAIPGAGCFAAARGAPPNAPVVLYLHGMYERSAGVDEELDRQRRVAAHATARGFAVLALRGKEGECNSRPELATWFCWPSNERTAQDAVAFVSAWRPALRETERRAGAGKRFVLGFSNGAFFAGLLAVRAHFEAAAFVVAHGGPVEPVHALGAKPPLLLMSADDDESQDGMIRFDGELARDAWPHEVYARGGGHALTDDDIEAALTFFVRAEREKVPLSPPLTTHRPQPHARDAAPSSPAADAEPDEPAPSEGSDEPDDAP
jgi:predicted esterase